MPTRFATVFRVTEVFSWNIIRVGLERSTPHRELADIQVTLTHTGHTGRMHFHTGCPPLLPTKQPNPDPHRRQLTLEDVVREITPSRRHTCANDFDQWLLPRDQAELRLFAAAVPLLAPWEQARDSAARRGRAMIPFDNAPLTSGALATLLADSDAHLSTYPDRAHVTALRTELAEALSAWSELLDRRDEVEAADPLAPILTWAHAEQLPDLQGTHKQVRWAQRIRYDAAQSGAVSTTMLLEEDSANVWIGLSTQDDVTTEGWRALQSRVNERLAYQRECRSAWCSCGCHR